MCYPPGHEHDTDCHGLHGRGRASFRVSVSKSVLCLSLAESNIVELITSPITYVANPDPMNRGLKRSREGRGEKREEIGERFFRFERFDSKIGNRKSEMENGGV